MVNKITDFHFREIVKSYEKVLIGEIASKAGVNKVIDIDPWGWMILSKSS